jgi:predicted urease superfamily metal-dependent hydrolase
LDKAELQDLPSRFSDGHVLTLIIRDPLERAAAYILIAGKAIGIGEAGYPFVHIPLCGMDVAEVCPGI